MLADFFPLILIQLDLLKEFTGIERLDNWQDQEWGQNKASILKTKFVKLSDNKFFSLFSQNNAC